MAWMRDQVVKKNIAFLANLHELNWNVTAMAIQKK